MTCRKVRKLIPLAAGGDLRPGRGAAFRAHLDRCPACRRELEGFRAALRGIKTEARAEGVVAGWSEAEWRVAMARVAAEARGESRGESRDAGADLGPRWAAAAAAGAVLSLVVMGLLFRGPSEARRDARSGQGLVAASSGRTPQDQDRMAITMVSPESGLQVVWILDKNFDWKGDQN